MTRNGFAGTLARMDARTIGARIGERMAAVGLEEIDIAAAARVSQSTVNRWLNGISDPRAENLPAIATALRVTEHWLITGDERSLVEKLVGEMRADGFSDAEIADTLMGFRNAKRSEASSDSEQHEGEPRAPLQSGAEHERRRGVRRGVKARGERHPRGPRPPRNPDEGQP